MGHIALNKHEEKTSKVTGQPVSKTSLLGAKYAGASVFQRTMSTSAVSHGSPAAAASAEDFVTPVAGVVKTATTEVNGGPALLFYFNGFLVTAARLPPL